MIKRCIDRDALLQRYRPKVDSSHMDWLVYCTVVEILREEPVIELEVDNENADNPRQTRRAE